jgi:hypothetical protein
VNRHLGIELVFDQWRTEGRRADIGSLGNRVEGLGRGGESGQHGRGRDEKGGDAGIYDWSHDGCLSAKSMKLRIRSAHGSGRPWRTAFQPVDRAQDLPLGQTRS